MERDKVSSLDQEIFGAEADEADTAGSTFEWKHTCDD